MFGDYTAEQALHRGPERRARRHRHAGRLRDERRRPGRHRLRARRGALLGRDQRGRGPEDRARLSAPARARRPCARRSCPPTSSAPLPNRTHGPPLAFGLVQPAGAALRAADGGHTRRERRARQVDRLRALRRRSPAIPDTPADEADVALRVSITDVRRRSELADYTGQLQASAGTPDHRRGQPGLLRRSRRQRCRTARSPGPCRARPRPTRRSDRPARSRPRPTRSPPEWSRRACARSGSWGRSGCSTAAPDGVASTTPNTAVRRAGHLRSVSAY